MCLKTALAATTGQIPECLAARCIDLRTGHAVEESVVEAVPGVTDRAFDGIHQQARTFREIIIFGDSALFIFFRPVSHPQHLISLVCRKAADPYTVLHVARPMFRPRYYVA